jgi:hypothetical protein
MPTDEELSMQMMKGMQSMSMALLAEDLEGANKGFLQFMGTFVRALSPDTIAKLKVLCESEVTRRSIEGEEVYSDH